MKQHPFSSSLRIEADGPDLLRVVEIATEHTLGFLCKGRLTNRGIRKPKAWYVVGHEYTSFHTAAAALIALRDYALGLVLLSRAHTAGAHALALQYIARRPATFLDDKGRRYTAYKEERKQLKKRAHRENKQYRHVRDKGRQYTALFLAHGGETLDELRLEDKQQQQH